MAGAFVSSAGADNGANYTPPSATDGLLVWVGGSFGAGVVTSSGQTFGGTSMTEPPNQDQGIDIAGNGDPCGFLAHLVNPGTSSATLSNTWSSARSGDNGRALTLSGIDQTTPRYATNGAQGGTYTSTDAPSLTYDAPADGVVIYWRIHAQGGAAITWTAPSGFTLAGTTDIVTSPARRQIGIWYKEVSSAEVGSSVSATSGASGDGIHGVVVYQAASGATTTPKSVSATHTATASMSKIVTYARTHTATHTASASISRLSEFFRTFTATHTGTASVSKFSEFFRTFTATATHASSFTKGVVLSVLSAVTHTGTAGLSALSVLGLSFTAGATHTANVIKKVFKSFSSSHTSTADVSKTAKKTLTATTTSTASEEHSSIVQVTSNTTHTASASSSETFIAGTPTFSFIKGVIVAGVAMIGKLIKGNRV